jgi:hypothetical protein
MRQTPNDGTGLTGVLRHAVRGHRRLLSVAAALVVTAGAAGASVALASTDARSSPDGGVTAAHAARTTIHPPAETSGAGDASGATGSAAVACPLIPNAPEGQGGGVAVPDGVNAAVAGDGVGTAGHVFTRTTADGVVIRVYRLRSTSPCGCGPEDTLSLEMSDASAVGNGMLDVAPEPSATTANADTTSTDAMAGAFGVAEGAPVWWVAVSVGPRIATVQMTFAGGSTDQMAPVSGTAVLARQIDPTNASSGAGPYAVRGTLRLLDASGAVVRTVTLPDTAPGPPMTPLPVSPPMAVPGSPPSQKVPTPSTVETAPSSTTSVSTSAAVGGAMTACPEVAPDSSSPGPGPSPSPSPSPNDAPGVTP